MTNDDGRKPEGAPERSPKACAGAPSDVEGRLSACPDWLQAALQEFADPNVAFVT